MRYLMGFVVVAALVFGVVTQVLGWSTDPSAWGCDRAVVRVTHEIRSDLRGAISGSVELTDAQVMSLTGSCTQAAHLVAAADRDPIHPNAVFGLDDLLLRECRRPGTQRPGLSKTAVCSQLLLRR